MKDKSEFKFGSGENDEQFNFRVAENWKVLKEFIDKNFDKKATFIERMKSTVKYTKQSKLAGGEQPATGEMRHNARKLFVMDARAILQDVCGKNYEQFTNLEDAYNSGQAYDFNSYISYNLPSENQVVKGDTGLSAVTIKLASGKKTKSGNRDEMYIRFAASEELILDEDTKDVQVVEWFNSIDEIFVEYDEAQEIGYDVNIWSISEQGSRLFTPEDRIIDIDDFDELSDLQKRLDYDKKEINDLELLYKKLADMQIVPFEVMHIGK
ncbi:MAG: hypothetical protein WCP03_01275 [Candidatus Saccharibacteria bacterium]